MSIRGFFGIDFARSFTGLLLSAQFAGCWGTSRDWHRQSGATFCRHHSVGRRFSRGCRLSESCRSCLRALAGRRGRGWRAAGSGVIVWTGEGGIYATGAGAGDTSNAAESVAGFACCWQPAAIKSEMTMAGIANFTGDAPFLLRAWAHPTIKTISHPGFYRTDAVDCFKIRGISGAGFQMPHPGQDAL